MVMYTQWDIKKLLFLNNGILLKVYDVMILFV